MKTHSRTFETSFPNQYYRNLVFLLIGITLTIMTSQIAFIIAFAVIYLLKLVPNKLDCKISLTENDLILRFKSKYYGDSEFKYPRHSIRSIDIENEKLLMKNIAIAGSILQLLGIRNQQFKRQPTRLTIHLNDGNKLLYELFTDTKNIHQLKTYFTNSRKKYYR